MPSLTAEQRFWDRVARLDHGCWQWTGSLACEGYGRIWVNGQRQFAHRFAYELLVGRIPEGRQIDHLCRNRGCVNPEHLEPVTRKTNILRGESPAAAHGRATHCVNGHEFTPENTRISTGKRERRVCRACVRDRARRALGIEPENFKVA